MSRGSASPLSHKNLSKITTLLSNGAMAIQGRPKQVLELSEEEVLELRRLVRRVRVNKHVALRAKIVLAAADGQSNQQIADNQRMSPTTVGKWRRRFVEGRVEALFDEPRPGAPRKIRDDDVEALIIKTLESKPKGRTHWSTREMAAKAGVSQSSVSRIWRAFGLRPHVVRGFKLSNDPLFIEKVRDIVGLYMAPPDHAVVFCFDEKPQIQALERAQPVLPMDLGQPERQTHNYLRHGTVDLLAALNTATGEVIGKLTNQHRAQEFVNFLRLLDRSVEPELSVHLILDNLAAHKTPAVQRWLVQHPRFVLHFTPTYASWMNLIERFFGLLTEHALKRGSHSGIPALRKAIVDYIEAHNERGKPFVWTKTADEVLDNVGRAARRILQVNDTSDGVTV